MKKLRKLYFKLFKCYRRLEFRCMTYAEADMKLKANAGKSERDQWRIANEENNNWIIDMVMMERRERITE